MHRERSCQCRAGHATAVRAFAALVRLVCPPPMVPVSLGPLRPLYLVLGGAVLLQLTLPFLYQQHPLRAKRWVVSVAERTAARLWLAPQSRASSSAVGRVAGRSRTGRGGS